MKNQHSKLAIGIAILFEIISLINAFFNIISKQWFNLYLLFLLIICITLPFIITHIANRKNLFLPSSFQLISLLFILASQFFGEFLKFYTIFPWWDLLLHGVFGWYAVIIGFHLIKGVIIKEKEITKKGFTIFTTIFAFCFAMTLGTLWEIFEFLADYFFKTDMTSGSLEDTMTDLIIKALLALVTSIICYFLQMKNSKQLEQSTM